MITIKREEYNRLIRAGKGFAAPKSYHNPAMHHIRISYQDGKVFAEACDSHKIFKTQVELFESAEEFDTFFMPITPLLKKTDGNIITVEVKDGYTVVRTVNGSQFHKMTDEKWPNLDGMTEYEEESVILERGIKIQNLIEALQGMAHDEYANLVFSKFDRYQEPIYIVSRSGQAMVLPAKVK